MSGWRDDDERPLVSERTRRIVYWILAAFVTAAVILQCGG